MDQENSSTAAGSSAGNLSSGTSPAPSAPPQSSLYPSLSGAMAQDSDDEDILATLGIPPAKPKAKKPSRPPPPRSNTLPAGAGQSPKPEPKSQVSKIDCYCSAD